MSILIKGMEMPKSCHFCELYEAEMYWCAAAKRDIEELDNYENRSSFCPLVHVPPHGRLIDADALLKDDSRKYDMYRGLNGRDTTLDDACHRAIQWTIEDAPTIIPAEEGE